MQEQVPHRQVLLPSSLMLQNILVSIAASLVYVAQSSPSTTSPADLQLCVDLSSYPLQHLPGTGSSSPRTIVHQHLMVLRPRQPKTTLSTTTATASTASFNWVVSLSTHEPLVFNYANRYEVWHSAMREEIQALRVSIHDVGRRLRSFCLFILTKRFFYWGK